MKLHVRCTFTCSPEVYWESFDHPDWEAAEARASSVRFEVVDHQERDGVITRRTRFYTGVSLPGLVASRLGYDTLHYEQVSRIDKAAGRLDWTIDPPAMKDRIEARGTVIVRATETGCEEVLDGEVVVDIPIVGGQIEKGVVDGVVQGQRDTAARRTRWLAQTGRLG